MKKTLQIAFTCGLLAMLLSHCATTPKVPEQISFPVNRFAIDPSKDTTLFGEQGTRIFIGPETFQFSDGTPITDAINIELTEFYQKSDIILADLSTRSDDNLLETGGMLFIEANSENRRVEIKADKKIVVHFPKDRFDSRDMDLFYGDEQTTDTSVANWDVDTVDLVKKTLKLGSFGWWYPAHDDSTSFDFRPANWVDTGYFWNPLDFYISSYEFSDEAIEEIQTTLNVNNYPKFVTWNDFGVQCETYITTEGDIKNPKVMTNVSRATRDEIIAFMHNLPPLEPGKNKLGEIIERRGLIFIQGGKIVPLYKTDEAYLKSFNNKYARYENTPIKSMDDAELNHFVFSVSKLGWVNCDRFIDEPEVLDLIVQTPVDPKTKLKLAFGDINGVLMPHIEDGRYVFSNVPRGKDATLIGLKNHQGIFEASIMDISISDEPILNLEFEKTTLAELREALESI